MLPSCDVFKETHIANRGHARHEAVGHIHIPIHIHFHVHTKMREAKSAHQNENNSPKRKESFGERALGNAHG